MENKMEKNKQQQKMLKIKIKKRNTKHGHTTPFTNEEFDEIEELLDELSPDNSWEKEIRRRLFIPTAADPNWTKEEANLTRRTNRILIRTVHEQMNLPDDPNNPYPKLI